jgi:hypothetical protein
LTWAYVGLVDERRTDMTDEHQSRQSSTSALLRGHFTDGHTHFAVHASTAKDPDAFHVSVSDNPADIVLIVSGLIDLKLIG